MYWETDLAERGTCDFELQYKDSAQEVKAVAGYKSEIQKHCLNTRGGFRKVTAPPRKKSAALAVKE